MLSLAYILFLHPFFTFISYFQGYLLWPSTSGRLLLLNTFGTKIFGWGAGNRFIKRLHVYMMLFSFLNMIR